MRARTISVKRMTKRELEIGRLLYPETGYYKPRTRAECVDGPRPCPFVSCKHHLYIDVSPRTGAIKLNFPDLEVWDMGESCALDVADRGGTTLEDVGAIMNLTRERIRQVEVKALAKLEALRDMMALRDYVDEGPVGKRRLPRLTQADLAGVEPDAARRRRRFRRRRRGPSEDVVDRAGCVILSRARLPTTRRKLAPRTLRTRSGEKPRRSINSESRGNSRHVARSRGGRIAPSQSLPSEAWSSPTVSTMCST